MTWEYPRQYRKNVSTAIPSVRIAQTAVMFLFIALLPTQLGKHFFLPFSFLSGVRVDYLAPALYLSDILAVILIMLHIRAVIHFFRNLNVQMYLLLCALIIPAARSPEIALYWYVKLIEFFAVFAVFRTKRIADRVIFAGFFTGLVVQTSLVFAQFFLKHSVQGLMYYLGERNISLAMAGVAKVSLNGIELLRPYGTFSHPNSLAGFYTLLFAFYLVTDHVNIRPILRILFLGLSAILVLFSFSKVALIALVVVNILYVIYQWHIYRECLLCLAARAAVLAALCALFLSAQADPLTVVKRIGLARNALTIILQNPIWGVGMGNYVIAQHAFRNPYLYFFAQPVHNIFLLTIVQIGIPLSGITAYFLIKARSTIRHFVMFVFLIAPIIITGMFDHYWLTLQQNIFLIAVLFALI